MRYPLMSEYVDAAQGPAGNLDNLSHRISSQDDSGKPTELLSTEVTEEDLADTFTDEFGVK